MDSQGKMMMQSNEESAATLHENDKLRKT